MQFSGAPFLDMQLQPKNTKAMLSLRLALGLDQSVILALLCYCRSELNIELRL